ncbi:cytochrome P450 [Nocardia transvalensis]|uniref:Cytochrome P450 n=1 Tax=Nocardia transvalensis TaxID=37333 RepID=A0A7W9PG16_9NOCA|nr:cytochrome P450 [Nocardia transvalensis]MBB5915472.1 cytochrome P450 [Nocardia transvalensis]
MSETLTDAAATAAVPEYPMIRSSGCPFAPPEEAMRLGREKPLNRVRIWDGSTPWLVTGYAEFKTLMSDPRVSVDDHRPGFPHWNEGMAAIVDSRPKSLFTTDGEEHSRYRRMLTKPFTFKRVEALRPAIQQITDEHIDRILAGPKPADLVTGLALPVPTLMISEMLGVPYEDHEFFQKHASLNVDRFATKEQAAEGRSTLARYLVDLVKKKLDEPAEDLVSDIAERVRAGEIDMGEAAQLGTGVLIAGHETSANMISLGALALLDNPEQFALLRDTDDPKIVANAVEELMRYLSIIQNGQRRVAVDDIEIAGETVRAGDGLIFDLAPANWDQRQWERPDELDLRRPAGGQLGFGFGPHQCVGQQLARAELQIVFRTLVRRIPTLRLAIPFDDVEFKHDRLAFGVYELPVTW